MEPSDEQASPTSNRLDEIWTTIRKNKCTILLLILIFDILLGVGTYFYIIHFYYKSIPPCSSRICVVSSAELIKKIDFTANPCEDFHEYACGTFEETSVLPAYRSNYDPFIILQDSVDEQLRLILDMPVYQYDTRPIILAKNLYHSCMNAKLVEANSLKTLREIYQRLGGWPVIENENWNETAFNWETTSYRLMLEGLDFHTFFKVSILPDNNNTNKYQIALFQPTVQKFENSLLTDSEDLAVEAYFKYMVEIAQAFGANSQQAYKQMQDVVNFSIKLVGLTRPIEHILNGTTALKQMKIRNLEKKYPFVKWHRYINNLFNSSKKFNYDDSVIVTAPEYFEKLGDLLQDTPKRVLANYMFWEVTKDMVDYLNQRILDATTEYLNINTGTIDRLPRAKLCLETTLQLDVAIGAILTRQLFKSNIGDSLDDIIDNIRNQLILSIKSVDWMDNVTRQHALQKAESVNTSIGFPKEYLDDNFIEEYYKNLTFNDENYIESILQLKIFQHKKFYQEYDKIYGKKALLKNRWLPVASVIAFYNPFENIVEIPAALLQQPFYNEDNPEYLNYAGIGYIIGREIAHGFDSEGQQFDQNGNLINWWQLETKNAHIQKTECMIEQYSNITIADLKTNLDGVQSLDENVVDNAGIQFAYKAYKRWAQFHRDELKLPGLKFNPFQLFWLAFAQQYCSIQTFEEIKMNVYDSNFVLPKYRVNVPLMNSEEFARDFNCPHGSKMNPIRKCKVW